MRTHDIDGYPTTCATCGQPVLKTKGSASYETSIHTGHKAAWHTHCQRPKLLHMTQTTQPTPPTQPAPPTPPPPPDDDEDNGD